jgi:hypothetical protein
MCNRAPPHIPGHCPPAVTPPDLGCRGLVAGGAETLDAIREVLFPPMAEIDPFCSRHGRRSRPVEIPGLRCDCPPAEKSK